MEILLDEDDSRLLLVKRFVDCELEELYFNEEPEIVVRGKVCHQRRDVAFYSDCSSGYSYSGRVAESYPLTEQLRELMIAVNEYCVTEFNGILANKYRNGDKYIGMHSDDERELSGGMVVSLSFGATRTFRVHKDGRKYLDVPLEDGDMLIMEGRFQEMFKHSIPQEKRVMGERISLTFRKHN